MPESLPDLFTYLDYRSFLRDWFAARKKLNPRFSHRLFARLAGQRSPSLLKHVIDGQRNLTPDTTQAFLKALDLTGEQAQFFRWLVKLDQAELSEERNKIWLHIGATRRFIEARRIEGEGFRYLSHWYIPAVRELATLPGFCPDPDWIAQSLRPEITPAEAGQALQTLQELGLLVPGPDGQGLRPAEALVVTPHEVARLAVQNYHQGMLRLASDSMEAFGPEERHLGAVTLALPERMVPQLKQELASFQERLCSLIEGVQDPLERVYQVNLQLFPLSASVPSDTGDGETQ